MKPTKEEIKQMVEAIRQTNTAGPMTVKLSAIKDKPRLKRKKLYRCGELIIFTCKIPIKGKCPRCGVKYNRVRQPKKGKK